MSIEEPAFRLRLRDGRFEIRDYPALVVAEVEAAGDQKAAVSRGFRALAGFIFGGNVGAQKIAMTAPVLQLPLAAADGWPDGRAAPKGWLVRFTMPSRWSLASLPRPRDGRIRLRQLAPARYAAMRFSGLAAPADVASRTDALLSWMRGRDLRAAGPATLAQYDPPWTLPFLRRNEVLIPLAP